MWKGRRRRSATSSSPLGIPMPRCSAFSPRRKTSKRSSPSSKRSLIPTKRSKRKPISNMSTLYEDKLIEVTDQEMIFHRYYLPFRSAKYNARGKQNISHLAAQRSPPL